MLQELYLLTLSFPALAAASAGWCLPATTRSKLAQYGV
jgi:hypothetical protein